jgi:hypothetical protein
MSAQSRETPHISVTIATFRRCVLLKHFGDAYAVYRSHLQVQCTSIFSINRENRRYRRRVSAAAALKTIDQGSSRSAAVRASGGGASLARTRICPEKPPTGNRST